MKVANRIKGIADWGVCPTYPERQNRITRLLNQVCLAILGIVIVSFCFQIVKHSIISGTILPHTWLMPFTFLPFSIVLFLNRGRSHFLARLFFILHNFAINIFWITMMGDVNNIAFSFVIFPIPIALLFRKLNIQLLLVSACFVGFLFCNWISDTFTPFLDASATLEFQHTSFAIWLLLSFLMLRIFTKEINLAEEELIQKNKELDQFSRVASHDLKEPLRTISSFSSLLLHKYKGKVSSDLDNYAHFINSSSLRMGNLLDDLLMHTTIDSAKRNLEPVDLNEVLSQVKDNLKTQIEASHAVIEIDKLPIISGLESRMVQLFQNLISNSIKFRKADSDPRIKIQSTMDGERVFISVSDNGIGVPSSQLDKVFDSFHRVHSKDKYEGSGIGLTTCKKIAEIHNGELSIESIENEGTVVTLSLPK